MLLFCGRQDHLITVFNINCERDLDLTILSALLKADSSGSRIDHLRLALSWNRPDIAEERIFHPDHASFPEGSLDEILLEALKTERIDFIRLLLQNGVSVEEFLTPSRLQELYAHTVISNNHLRHLLGVTEKQPRVHLSQVAFLIRKLCRKFIDPVYDSDRPQAHRLFAKQHHQLNGVKSLDDDVKMFIHEELTNPLEDIFYWAILSAMPEVAQAFWERCAEQIKLAIVATALFNGLLLTIRKDSTRKRNLYDKARLTFERLAVSVIDLCYERDREKAMSLVERRNKRFGEQTSLELAQVGNARTFIATSCCQNAMEQMWIRGMSYCTWSRVVVTLFCPFLVATNFIKFIPLGDDGGDLSFPQKVLTFYKAPVTKFLAYTMAYVVFLCLYSYMVLFDLRYRMTPSEFVVLLWSLIYFIEEIREVVVTPSSTLSEKLAFWKKSIWNSFDALAYLFGIVGFSLRFSSTTFPQARILYSMNTAFLYIRLFRAFHASYRLGPKLVTFYRMIAEVAMFLIMLGVFLLGYGIASQALHDPFQTFSLPVFVNNIIYIPYWQMYGELQLETLEVGTADPWKCMDGVCENLEEYGWVRQLMLAFYLIVSNILLLNMLIAVFTYVFDEVHENSMEIWKYEMFRLVQEYDDKPGLVPPFIIFEHVWLLFKGIWKRCCRKEKEDLEALMKTTVEMLRVYEKECTALYMTDKKNNSNSSIEERIKKVQENIEELLKKIDETAEDGEWVDTLANKFQLDTNGLGIEDAAKHSPEKDSGIASDSSPILENSTAENESKAFETEERRVRSGAASRGISKASLDALREMISDTAIGALKDINPEENVIHLERPRTVVLRRELVTAAPSAEEEEEHQLDLYPRQPVNSRRSSAATMTRPKHTVARSANIHRRLEALNHRMSSLEKAVASVANDQKSILDCLLYNKPR